MTFEIRLVIIVSQREQGAEPFCSILHRKSKSPATPA
jgi:hypothetical protein